jgi:hypothetical protein
LQGIQENAVKLKTLIAIPVVLALLAYAGIKGYIYFKVKSELDRMVQMAAPFADIEYGGIGSDLSGTLSVENILVAPAGTNEEMIVRRIEVAGDGPGFLLDLMKGFDKGEPPPRMSVTMRQADLPVSGDLFSGVGPQFSFGPAGQESKKPKACTLSGILQTVGLDAIGYSSVTANANMKYEYTQAGGEVSMSFDYDLVGIESLAMDVEMSGFTAAGAMGLGQMPAFGSIRMSYRVEPDYMKRMISYCAGRVDKQPQGYINSLFSQSDAHYLNSLGFIPGEGLKTMFKELLTKGGQVDLSARPSSQMNPAMFGVYRPEDIVRMMGLNVSYNEKQVTDLSFYLESQDEVAGSTSATKSGSGKAGKKELPRLYYQDTSIGELDKYLHHKVRIYTQEAEKPKQGRLVSVKNQIVTVEQVIHGGKFTAHLPDYVITRAEVLRAKLP